MNNFKLIAKDIDVQLALDALAADPKLWDEITLRQDYEGSAHKHTKAIYLRGPTVVDENVLDCIDSIALTQFIERVGAPVQDLIAKCVDLISARELGHVMLVKLMPNGWIMPHIDEGAYARYYARFHLVLSGHCEFRVGTELMTMHPGELWWFNHQETHSVVNRDADRIHLIIDASAPGYTGALRVSRSV